MRPQLHPQVMYGDCARYPALPPDPQRAEAETESASGSGRGEGIGPAALAEKWSRVVSAIARDPCTSSPPWCHLGPTALGAQESQRMFAAARAEAEALAWLGDTARRRAGAMRAVAVARASVAARATPAAAADGPAVEITLPDPPIIDVTALLADPILGPLMVPTAAPAPPPPGPPPPPPARPSAPAPPPPRPAPVFAAAAAAADAKRGGGAWAPKEGPWAGGPPVPAAPVGPNGYVGVAGRVAAAAGVSGLPHDPPPTVEAVRDARAALFRTAGQRMREEEGRSRGKASAPAAAANGAVGGCKGTTGPGVRGGFVPPLAPRGGPPGGGHGNGQAQAPPREPQGGDADKPASGLAPASLAVLGLSVADPLPKELASLEPRLIDLVCAECLPTDGSHGVRWDDIAGQEEAKSLVQELVVWPLLNPGLFTGARRPARGVLLFGPPGTGKSLLGRAVATNVKARFFSVSASSLTSKWIGEGEKLVRTLFAVAGLVEPSVIFLDEIDALLSARRGDGGEHEASRRMKTELLVQMEGVGPESASRRVLVVGATNRPEELDEAARRRLPKQLYLPLPCPTARRSLMAGALRGISSDLSESDFDRLVERTHGYSGSDLRHLVQEACQGPVRDAFARGRKSGGEGGAPGVPSPGEGSGAAAAALMAEDLRPVVLADFRRAVRVQQPSVKPSDIVRYDEYNAAHGAKSVLPEDGGSGDGSEWD